MKELGEYLRDTRIQNGVSIEEAAEDNELSASQLENIENGNVKALKAGTAIITATSGEFKDSYTLTVKENTNKIDKDEKTDNTTDNEKTTETVDQKEQTTQVDSKETKTTKKVASPKTGDINIALYLILMITSLCGIYKYIKNRK